MYFIKSHSVDRVTVCWNIRFGTTYSPWRTIFNFCQWPPSLIPGRPFAVKSLGAWQVSPPSAIPDNLCILFSLLYLENSTLSFKKAYLSVKRDVHTTVRSSGKEIGLGVGHVNLYPEIITVWLYDCVCYLLTFSESRISGLKNKSHSIVMRTNERK